MARWLGWGEMLSDDEKRLRAYLISLTPEARLQEHEANVADLRDSPEAIKIRGAHPRIDTAFTRYCERVEIARKVAQHRPSDLFGEVNACDSAQNFMAAMAIAVSAENDPDRLRGMKVAGGARNSAHQTNRKHVPLRNQRLSRMAELVPRLGVDNAARRCEKEGLGGWQGIKQQWNRRKKRDA